MPRELRRGRFDLVFADQGTLEEGSDLDVLAQGIVAALASGGDLLFYDEHPVAKAEIGRAHV